MSAMNSIETPLQHYNQSAFAIIAAGGDPSQRLESQSKRPQNRKLFDSAEYFYQQTILLEKAQRLREEQQRMEQQSRESFEQACVTMSEKYGTSSDQIKKLSQIHKEKKKFDSADYFMENQGAVVDETSEEKEDEDIADRVMRQQADKGETTFICCAKRNPLVPKQKKNFDSADFFMEEYGKNHPVSQQEWERMLETLIKQTEREYNQSVLPSDIPSSPSSNTCAQPIQATTAEPTIAIQIESQTDRIVQLQSERMEPLYILKKKKNPLINRGKSYYQFDSADYFMQQADEQNHTTQPSTPANDEVNIDESIKSQADICERHYILKKKTIIMKVADGIKKRKEFDSADYFMQKAAASSSSSDNSISED